MTAVDALTVKQAREYVLLAREVKRKKEQMKVLLRQLGPRVVQGVALPELGVRLVQHTGKYRSYPTQEFFDLLGLEVLLACATIDPLKVDAHLGTLPAHDRKKVEVLLDPILKVTLKPRHVIEELNRAVAAQAI